MGSKVGNLFTPVRNAVESAASLAGNYLLPGSSLLTDHLVSKGSQKQLGSTLGKIAQAGTGLAGGGVGSGFTGIPAASDLGAGWTNLANGAGKLVGVPNAGTNISNSLSNFLNGSGASAATSGTPSSFPDMPGSIPGSVGNVPTLANASNALVGGSTSVPTASSLSSALSSGTGGGGSSFGTLASLAGGANSLYANDQAQKDLLKANANAQAQIAPYTASGGAANSKLSDLLGISGNSTVGGYGSLTTPFTPDDLTKDPGYQFNLQQGNQALDRQAAAKGDYFSGGALKDAEQFGQGLADNTYNAAYQRYVQNQNNTYSKLAGQAGAGQAAAGTAGGLNIDTGNAQANAGISSSNILNSSLSGFLNGSGAKRPVNIGGQVVYI